MFTFKKSNAKVYPHVTSSFVVSNDGLTLVVTRTIDNKGKRLMTKLDNTIRTLNTKVLELTMMSNDEFTMFSDIQTNVEEVSDVV